MLVVWASTGLLMVDFRGEAVVFLSAATVGVADALTGDLNVRAGVRVEIGFLTDGIGVFVFRGDECTAADGFAATGVFDVRGVCGAADGGAFSLFQLTFSFEVDLAVFGVLVAEMFGVADIGVPCVIFMGDSGISSAGRCGRLSVNCSMLSSRESIASKDSSKEDDVLLCDDVALRLSGNDITLEDSSV